MRLIFYIGFYVLLFSAVFYFNSKRDEGVDVKTIKNYFYDTEQILIKRGDTCCKYNFVSNKVIKAALVEKVNTGIWYDVSRIKRKYAFSTLIDMMLTNGKSVNVSVCGFPCIAVEGRVVAVDASLYLALLEGRFTCE